MKPSSTHGLGIEPRHFLVGVALGWVEPHLNAAAAPSTVVAELVGVTPDFLTQSSRCGEVEGEGMAGGSHRTLVMPRGPVPSLVPIALAGKRALAVLPPLLTVLFAQGNIKDPLFAPALVHLLDPGSQVRGTLIEAGVLDKVPFAFRCHSSAVVPVEPVQVGNVLMCFLACVRGTAGIRLPGAALVV